MASFIHYIFAQISAIIQPFLKQYQQIHQDELFPFEFPTMQYNWLGHPLYQSVQPHYLPMISQILNIDLQFFDFGYQASLSPYYNFYSYFI